MVLTQLITSNSPNTFEEELNAALKEICEHEGYENIHDIKYGFEMCNGKLDSFPRERYTALIIYEAIL